MKTQNPEIDVYLELISLDYSRKENDLISVNSMNWDELQDELKNTILSFPSRNVKFNVDLMSIQDLSDDQFYVFHSNGNSYLVDTQGFDYPRYVIELNGFPKERLNKR